MSRTAPGLIQAPRSLRASVRHTADTARTEPRARVLRGAPRGILVPLLFGLGLATLALSTRVGVESERHLSLSLAVIFLALGFRCAGGQHQTRP